MTQDQLSMLFEYIHNEISLQAVRASGLPWQAQLDMRTELKTKLYASIVVEKLPSISNRSKDSPAPHDGANKFSPLMINMLLFAYHSGHEFHKFPGFNYRAQQQAYNWFQINDYFCLSDGCAGVSLTQKGQALVNKILNTTVTLD